MDWSDIRKSTCINAIIYALGLEGMFGPSQQTPFTEVMHTRLISPSDEDIKVRQSYVMLEIQNSKGTICTLERKVTGVNTDRQLIRVYQGAYIKRDRELASKDYFVRTKGAAQSELGFHVFLADFMELKLPHLSYNDGVNVPLYLECLFPFFFVDQASGWREIKSRMPTYLQIPDMSRRATEYILSLDTLETELRKQELEIQKENLESEWKETILNSEKKMPQIGFIIRGIPDLPNEGWLTSNATIVRPSEDSWIDLNRENEILQRRKTELEDAEIPRAKEVSHEAMAKIRKLEDRFGELQKQYERNALSITSDKEQLHDMDVRLEYLREDIRKHEDENRLRKRGGEISQNLYGNTKCPACGGKIKAEALLPEESSIIPMTLEESIEFIRDQIATFGRMKKDVLRVVKGREARSIELRNRINEFVEQIRAQKELLKSEGELPSVAAIRERLQIENRLDYLHELNSQFNSLLDNLSEIVKKWKPIKAELDLLTKAGHSELDNAKLMKLEEIYHQQLEEYEFKSYHVSDITISKYTYRPAVRGRDLAGTSASDAIRSIWAYLFAILKMSSEFNTNHLGFLILDEPRQQMVKEMSYISFLKQASAATKDGSQIIFATSEKLEDLQEELRDTDAEIRSFQGRIIKKLNNTQD
ncbi:MAG: hypothetical protein ACYSR0_11695 [Planctomycetota bacterium]